MLGEDSITNTVNYDNSDLIIRLYNEDDLLIDTIKINLKELKENINKT